MVCHKCPIWGPRFDLDGSGHFLFLSISFASPKKYFFGSRRRFLSVCDTFPPFYCYTFKMAGKKENDFKFKLCLISFDDKYHNMMMTITHLKDKAMIMCLIIFFKTISSKHFFLKKVCFLGHPNLSNLHGTFLSIVCLVCYYKSQQCE